jgi:uncharacterized RDD family membrane protein YckC
MARRNPIQLRIGDRSLSLAQGQSVLGRSRKCQLTLADPAASRRHARLTVEEGRLWVEDLSSSNGTFVNGRRVTGVVELRDGDWLAVGQTEMMVLMGAEGSGAIGDADLPPPPPLPRSEAERETADPNRPPPVQRNPAATASRRQLVPPSVAAARALTPAGPGRRLVAALVDLALVALLALLAAGVAGGLSEPFGRRIAVAVALAGGFLLPVVGWSRWGTTPGKRFLGLWVCDAKGRVGLTLAAAVRRWLLLVLLALPLGLGLLPVLAGRPGQHDKVADSSVRYGRFRH